MPIIISKRDTTQFYFRTRREEEIVAIATFPTSNAVMNNIGCIPIGLRSKCRLSSLLLLNVAKATISSSCLEIWVFILATRWGLLLV